MDYLLFTGSNCPACKNLKSWLESKAIKHQIIDVDQETNKAFQYKIRSLPTVIKQDSNGEAGRMTGFQVQESTKFFGV